MFDEITNGLMKANFKLAFKDALSYVAPEMEDQNRAQLLEGKLSNNSDITPPYADFTIKIKKRKGQKHSNVTLKDTGEFYKSIYADPVNDGIIFGANDEKANKLESKYSSDIFGLTDANLDKDINRIIELTNKNFFDDIQF